jgi:HEAT repeat protein
MSHLRVVEQSPDPNLRHRAYAGLAAPRLYDDERQKAEVAHVLAERLANGQEPNVTRAIICRTLGELKRPEGHDAVLACLDDPEVMVQTEAARALGLIGRQDDAATLARLMAAGSTVELRVAAIEALGVLKPRDARFRITLIDGMEHPDPAIRLASHDSLVAVVGRDFGVRADAWREQVLPKPSPSAPESETASARQSTPISSNPNISPPR